MGLGTGMVKLSVSAPTLQIPTYLVITHPFDFQQASEGGFDRHSSGHEVSSCLLAGGLWWLIDNLPPLPTCT